MKWTSFNVNIYRWSLGDCTNGGVTAKENTFTVYTTDEEADKSPSKQVLVMRKGPLGSVNLAPPKSQWPANQVGPMMGGNYAGGDSRFSEAVQELTGWKGFYGLVAVHDRFESQELNDILSR